MENVVEEDGRFQVEVKIRDEGIWHFPGPVNFAARYTSQSNEITFSVLAPSPTVTVTTNKAAYERGESIIVSGEVSEIWPNVSFGISVSSPSSRGIWSDHSEDSIGADKKFKITISPGGSNWRDSGTYAVWAGYGDYYGISYFE